ncbi:hypothetical protein ACIXSY_14290 [Bacteroides fragilis]|uniref:hypothetical protein n=1 Tax=Bacteroides fragilis TaxID=817 RepID=UPI0038532E56
MDVNKKFFKYKRLVICAQEPDNLQKTLTMLIEERYKEEDTGSDGVNSLPKPELSYSAGVYFFCLYFSDSLSVTDKKNR